MKNIFFIIIIVTISLNFETCYAQEKVTMMNGNIFFVNVGDTAGDFIKMVDPESKKTEVVDIEKARIFSILYANGKEVFIYKQDTLSEDNYLGVEEMRAYIAGAHDANSRYSTPLAFWGSFGIGAGSGVVFPAWISPIVAGGGALLLGSRWIKINRSHISDPKYLKDPNYLSGYENAARQARVQNVIKGAVIGLIIGAVGRYTLLE
ncbi:MAG TPA: hypothetical protein PK323_11905 [Bacteroidia bacterium]|nr:hypothetical protein [Bacteroidia bacterium]